MPSFCEDGIFIVNYLFFGEGVKFFSVLRRSTMLELRKRSIEIRKITETRIRCHIQNGGICVF